MSTAGNDDSGFVSDSGKEGDGRYPNDRSKLVGGVVGQAQPSGAGFGWRLATGGGLGGLGAGIGGGGPARSAMYDAFKQVNSLKRL